MQVGRPSRVRFLPNLVLIAPSYGETNGQSHVTVCLSRAHPGPFKTYGASQMSPTCQKSWMGPPVGEGHVSGLPSQYSPSYNRTELLPVRSCHVFGVTWEGAHIGSRGARVWSSLSHLCDGQTYYDTARIEMSPRVLKMGSGVSGYP